MADEDPVYIGAGPGVSVDTDYLEPTVYNNKREILEYITKTTDLEQGGAALEEVNNYIINSDHMAERFYVSGYLPPLRCEPLHLAVNGGSYRRPRMHHSPEERRCIQAHVQKLVEAGILRGPLDARHVHKGRVLGVFIKKEPGKPLGRLIVNAVDYNARAMETCGFEIADLQQCIQLVAGHALTIVADAASGFFQCPVDEESSLLQVIEVPTSAPDGSWFGRSEYYAFDRMLFGNASNPGIFSKLMVDSFGDINTGNGGLMTCCIDDIARGCDDEDTVAKTFIAMMDRASETGVRFKLSKLQLGRRVANYLRHLVSRNGTRSDCRPDSHAAGHNAVRKLEWG